MHKLSKFKKFGACVGQREILKSWILCHFVSSNAISLHDFKLILCMLGRLHKLQYEIRKSIPRLSKVRGSWFLEATDFCHPQARQIHRCIFAPVTSVNAHYYSVLTTSFDMVNAHYVIIDFRAKFFIKIQNQASDTSRSLPSFSSAPFLLRAVPSERLGQV